MADALAGKWIWVWNWQLVTVGAPVERLESEMTARSNGSASPPPAQRTYTVKSGDTLSGIAQKLGLASWRSLYEANAGVIGGDPKRSTRVRSRCCRSSRSPTAAPRIIAHMTYDCDVAVVGAGPAGSRTARNLARAGLRVRLLEEHRTVGVPSHCSGLISLRTLREAEIGEDAAIHRLTGAFVHTQSGGRAALGGEKTQAVAIDRVRWDQTLAEQAEGAGAEMVRARLTTVERENSHVKLHVQIDGRDSTMTARMVVGADGMHSRVGRTLGMPRPAEYAYNLGIEGRLTPGAGAEWRDDFVHVFVGRELAPGWFGWIIPIGDGVVRVGIGSSGPMKPIECYRRLARAFPALFASIVPCRMYGGTIPLTFAPRSYDDNVLLVGDAAGQVKPFSGGGIYTSLVAARHAAATIQQTFASRDFSARTLSSYERGWKREIGRELRTSWHLRHFGLALSDSQVDRVVRALRGPKLQTLAATHADIDYPSRVLLRLARSLPAMATLGWVAARRPGAALSLVRAHLPFVA